MSDKDTKTSESETPKEAAPAKKSDKKLFLLLGALFVFMAIAYGISLGPIPVPEAEVDEAGVEEIEQAYSEDSAEIPVAEDAEEALFDLALAKKERIIGDTSAPVKITEYASLSCGHCGTFHKETYPAFKEAYIDTGKAYLVFADFPLNPPALHATMTARCLPEDQYFPFINDLFENQDDWAYDRNYLSYLETKAGERGLSKEAFTQCVQSQELQDALVKRMQATQGQFNISSTPSFVVNNQVVISGAVSFEEFDQQIQNALAQIEAENTEPSAAPDTPEESSDDSE